MDIARIDYWAATGTSPLHRAAVLSKVLATAMVVAGVIMTTDPVMLVALYALIIITVRAARLPLATVLAISAFPGLFAILFALSYEGEGGAVIRFLIIMRALTAATSMILLVSTTPYTDVMSFFGRFLPRLISDGLFMTYRSFFILFDLLDHLLKALRLRGGIQARRLVRNAVNTASGVGMLFIHASTKSQMLYDVMTIRGYSGRLNVKRRLLSFGFIDIPYLAATASFTAYTVYMKSSGSARTGLFMPCMLLSYLVIMEALRAWKR